MPRPCVLVVDDDLDMREGIAELLRDLGYTVHEARHGLEALADMRATPPCIVVLDLMMPVMDGWEVLRQMQSDPALAQVPVCVVSAFADKAPPVRCVLPKPLDIDRLVAAIAHDCGAPDAA